MGVESIKEYRELELDIHTDASTNAYFLTESPGLAMAVRDTFTFDTTATTSGRRPVNHRLTGPCPRGKLAQLKITSAGVVRLFGAKVLCRPLGSSGAWSWADLPVEVTDPGWTQVGLPIEATPNEYTQSLLPIDPTPDEYSEYALPIEATPLNPIWVTIPVDAI